MQKYKLSISVVLDKLKMLCEIAMLQRIQFTFAKDLMKFENVQETFNHFNKRHPRIKLIRNKQIGVAFLDLSTYSNGREYFNLINGKNSAGYYARKCRARGYTLIEIDRNKFRNEIALIESSSPARQGRPMSSDYGDANKTYVDHSNYKYYGVMFMEDLVAYANIGAYGNFACISRLMGHAKHLNNGVMYFMISEVISMLISEGKQKYIIYDMWYGASSGLRSFKSKLGFMPCNAQWRIGSRNEEI